MKAQLVWGDLPRDRLNCNQMFAAAVACNLDRLGVVGAGTNPSGAKRQWFSRHRVLMYGVNL